MISGILFFVGCGSQNRTISTRPHALQGTTGFFDDDGVDYIHGGDPRVAKALEEPATPLKEDAKPEARSQPETVKPRSLKETLREFEITRFDKRTNKPTRFGADRASIKIFFRAGVSHEFSGEFTKAGSKLTFAASSERFNLTGEIADSANKSLGKFVLRDSSSSETAEIFYRAYRAKLNVRQDRTRQVVPGSGFENQLKSLREDTFGWVHNWTVLHGASFYLVDVVYVNKNASTAPPTPIISFKGPSKRTGQREHRAESLTPEASEVRLIGNSETGSRRLFEVTLEDRQSAEKNKVMVDIEAEEPDPPPAITNQDEPEESPDERGTQESDKAYLKIDKSLPRTGRMTIDFDKNRNIPGVRHAMAEYQKEKRSGLENFYRYAHPFRGIIEAIGMTFDVSPAYAYLTVVESAYFTGGKYKIERPHRKGKLLSSALGPFQILENTGRNLNLRITDLWKGDTNSHDNSLDERRYFTSSACGAAKYVGQLVNTFEGSDSTLSILAYYQGEGGAAAALYCTFEASGDKKACAKRINRGMKGNEYNRYLRLAKNYSYTYAELESVAAIPAHMRQYVNRKLAVYFISSDLARYGFSISSPILHLPNNGTVTPAQPIQDANCRKVVTSILR